jgi:hypothetical protein
VGRKEHDGARRELVGDDDLGVGTLSVLADVLLGQRDVDERRGQTLGSLASSYEDILIDAPVMYLVCWRESLIGAIEPREARSLLSKAVWATSR